MDSAGITSILITKQKSEDNKFLSKTKFLFEIYSNFTRSLIHNSTTQSIFDKFTWNANNSSDTTAQDRCNDTAYNHDSQDRSQYDPQVK